jgi:hypothetical protein
MKSELWPTVHFVHFVHLVHSVHFVHYVHTASTGVPESDRFQRHWGKVLSDAMANG